MTSRGFPNQFFTGFIQGGVSANTTAMFEQQAKHIAYVIAEAEADPPPTRIALGERRKLNHRFGVCR